MQYISPPLFPCILRRGCKRRNGMFFQGRRVKMGYTLLKDSSKRDGKWNDNKTLSFSTPNTQLPTEPFTHHHTGSLVLTDSLFSSNQAAVPAAEPERTLGNQAFRGLFPLHCCITLCHTQLILTFHPKTKLSRSSQAFITVYTHTHTHRCEWLQMQQIVQNEYKLGRGKKGERENWLKLGKMDTTESFFCFATLNERATKCGKGKQELLRNMSDILWDTSGLPSVCSLTVCILQCIFSQGTGLLSVHQETNHWWTWTCEVKSVLRLNLNKQNFTFHCVFFLMNNKQSVLINGQTDNLIKAQTHLIFQ